MYIKNKKFKIFVGYMILASIILIVVTKFSLFDNIDKIEKDNYKEQSLENIKILNALIDNKKNSTLNLALAVSNFTSIKEAIKQNNYYNLHLELLDFISTLDNYSNYKDVNIQIINKNGLSKYRSWTEKTNDSLVNIRYDLQEMLKSPKIMNTISVGRFTISFKSMVPIFENNKFIGVVEIITNFNSIIKYLEEIGIEPIILVDKKFQNQFYEKDKKTFIDGYFVANKLPAFEYLNFIKNEKIETFLNLPSTYVLKNPYIASVHEEYDNNGDIIATFLLFQKIDDIKFSSIEPLKRLSTLIVLAIVFTTICLILFWNFYIKRTQKEKTNRVLRLYNAKLKSRVKLEIEENRKKDMILANQTKHAAIGEMLGNIAHQWKQPLSAISTATSGLQVKYNYNLLTKNEFLELTNGVLHNTKYLSDTINDFRDFFRKDKTKVEFNPSTLVIDSYNILKSLYLSNNIQIKFELDEALIYVGYKNELSQVLLNLFSNAKDALILQENLEKKVVYVKLYSSNDFIIFEFHDNAGGVPEAINEKIFEPYFTTKHQAQGTGIGLYMSKEIIIKHFDGQIYNENEEYIFENNKYFGANFIVKLPIYHFN